jgi:hypothetical protein
MPAPNQWPQHHPTQTTTTTTPRPSHLTGNYIGNLHDQKEHIVAAVKNPHENLAENLHSKLPAVKVPDLHHVVTEKPMWQHVTSTTPKPYEATTTTRKPFDADMSTLPPHLKQFEHLFTTATPFEYTTTTHRPTLKETIQKQIFNKNEQQLETAQWAVGVAQDIANSQLSGIKQHVDNKAAAASQFNDAVYNLVSAQTNRFYDTLNSKLERIEDILQRFRPSGLKSNDHENHNSNHEQLHDHHHIKTTRWPTLRERLQEQQQILAEKLFKKKEQQLDTAQWAVDVAQDIANAQLSGIKQKVDNNAAFANQFNEGVYNLVAAQTNRVFDTLSKKIERIEAILQRFKPGTLKSNDEEISEVEAIKDDEQRQILAEKLFDRKEQQLETAQWAVDVAQDIANAQLSGIKQKVDNNAAFTNQLNENVLNLISAQTNRVFDTLNKKLERIETILYRLRPGSFKSNDDEISEIEAIEGDIDEMRSLIDSRVDDNENMLRNEEKKEPTSKVADALKNAGDRFNQMIDDQLSRFNNRITEINARTDNLFGQLQSAVKRIRPTKKVYTPPTYKPTPPSVIDWKPKPTTWSPSEYDKYTIADDYRKENFTDEKLDRMDTEVTTDEDNESATAPPEEVEDDLTDIDNENFEDDVEDDEVVEGGIADNIPLNDEGKEE